MDSGIEASLSHYVVENFLFADPDTQIAPNASLLEEEILDSTGVLQLVMHLEETYGLTVEGDEITPENFDSIARLAGFVRRKLGQAATQTA